MRAAVPSLLLLLALTGSATPTRLARVRPNDNRVPAGVLRGGVLTLRLEARAAEWHPDGERAPGAIVPAFAEVGRAAQIPGPLVRVPAGTAVEVTLRNALDTTLVVHGLYDRTDPTATTRADQPRSMSLAPGTSRAVRFRLDAPGTYYYWGTTTGQGVDFRIREDAQLTGAIVVDPAGESRGSPRDRVLVIGMWSDTVARAFTRRQRVLAVVNGRAWPNTERLAYAVGDSVRWRVLNTSADLHPMHLHGFYFRVDSRGDGVADTVYRDGVPRMANTEAMTVGSVMSLTWVPERSGNWLFHCHIPEHFAPRGPLGAPPADPHAAHAAAGHAMSGLVLGIAVRDTGTGARAVAVARAPDDGRRSLRLLVRENGGSTADVPLYGFATHARGTAEPPADSGRRAGPPLVLTRGEPVRITVVNRLSQPTAVHWHGIELESWFDGVPGVSGSGTRVAPMIAPGDSFEVRFTPPRAGTFIYHTHVDEERQQGAGLAGPLLVLEPGARHDSTTDIPVLIGSPGDFEGETRLLLLNGRAEQRPLTLRAGQTHRLRLINMSVRRSGLVVGLYRGDARVPWRMVAKDGADLPPSLRGPGPARQILSIGETLDVEVTPETPGDSLTLEVRLGIRGNARRMAVWPLVVR
jgi:FtsP/CotA-like multicopper oxidase with cupredoxin domain